MQRIKCIGVVHLAYNLAFDPMAQVVGHDTSYTYDESRHFEVSVRFWSVDLGDVKEFPEGDTALAEGKDAIEGTLLPDRFFNNVHTFLDACKDDRAIGIY